MRRKIRLIYISIIIILITNLFSWNAFAYSETLKGMPTSFNEAFYSIEKIPLELNIANDKQSTKLSSHDIENLKTKVPVT